jgi:hypothetical protein
MVPIRPDPDPDPQHRALYLLTAEKILIWKAGFRQQWTGWPEGVGEDVTLAQSGIARAHTLTVNQVAPPGTIKSLHQVQSSCSSRYNQVAPLGTSQVASPGTIKSLLQVSRSSRYNQVAPLGTVKLLLSHFSRYNQVASLGTVKLLPQLHSIRSSR